MKGLLLSLFVLVLNIVSTAAVAHVLRPKRYLYLFALSALAWGVAYVILYASTPADLYFLSPRWVCTNAHLDLLYGFAVFLLNCHTFVDCFFATCGGFSVSLLMAILNPGGKSITTDALVTRFKAEPESDRSRLVPGRGPVDKTLAPHESDRIYAWRVPHLAKRGYIRRDEQTGNYMLTSKGRMIALLTLSLKRMMNLGEGG
jgi:hypothetical protein